MPFSRLVKYWYNPIKFRSYKNVFKNPNPDIENAIIAQPLGTPSKSKKLLNTNEVSTNFSDSLYTPIDCTLFCISISRFGKKVNRIEFHIEP